MFGIVAAVPRRYNINYNIISYYTILARCGGTGGGGQFFCFENDDVNLYDIE